MKVLMHKPVSIFIVSCMILLFGCSSPAVRVSTALANVAVLTPALPMPGLHRARTLRIYLPPGYVGSATRYPVLYMHDGQNLFDDATSFVGEWGVDESLNWLAKSIQLELIVVGIDHGAEKRMNELSPWGNEKFGIPEGEEYMKFIVGVVKPYIDSHYRTLPTRENTAIMGSSMGGLISQYAIFQFPHIFSKAGIFSPSYWYSEQSYIQAASRTLPVDSRLYWMMGGKEGAKAVDDTRRMFALVQGKGLPMENVFLNIVPEAGHNETAWRAEFPRAVVWLFGKPKGP